MIISQTPVSSLPQHVASAELNRFRSGFFDCLTRRADVLFELTDAVACGTMPVTDLARLSLEVEHRRGHGGLYDALNVGRIDTDQLATTIAQGPVPKVTTPDGKARIVLAVDVSNWLRPDAATSPDRAFCHTYARGKGQADMIPGWPYSFVAALETGATSWTALLDVVRLHPNDDATVVTATQLRAVVESLCHAGHYHPGDPDILVVADAGYDVVRLAWLLDDLPVIILGRLRSDRVFYGPPGKRKGPTKGRGPRHGHRLALRDPGTHGEPTLTTSTLTSRYGRADAVAFGRMHPKIDARAGWKHYKAIMDQPPIIEGTIIRLHVERLPGDRHPKPVWLWTSKPTPASDAEVDHWWSMFIRRFDLEHTFRFLKQTLGWTRPHLRSPKAADLWTWLIIAAHTQLRLARPVARDYRLPWQKPLAPTMLTPARVRSGYRRICQTAIHPAAAPKASRAGPGRPKG
ncbi:NF041680 family putative transposase, partial [Yaniella flava]|uniref:NF041680 family putative transposase n=1 Tax=Yaniella flava TaxID=287930 RepID=UPI0031E29446